MGEATVILSDITQKAITVSDILSNFDFMVAEAIIKPARQSCKKGCFF